MQSVVLNTKPKIIKSTKYSTINLVFIYPIIDNYEHLFELDLLKNLLAFSSNKYKTEQTFKKNLLNKLIINYDVNYIRKNENIYFKFNLCIPDPKIVKSFKLEEAIKLFIETIYNPNAKNKEFNKREFKREVNYLKENILNSKKNIYSNSYSKFQEHFNLDSFKKTNVYYNLDKIDNITPKSLYSYYEKLIIKNNPLIYIYGNVSDEFNNLLKKYYNYKNLNISIENRFNNFFDAGETKYIEEESNYENSILYMGYIVSNMKEEDKKYLSLLNNIIKTGTGINILFQKLRVENNLVYSVYSNDNKLNGTLVIETTFNSKKKDIIIKLIREVIENIDYEFVVKSRERILFEMEYDKIRSLDYKYKLLIDTINSDLKTTFSLEEVYDIYKNIDIDEFMKFYKRLKLNLIYFLKGDIDE